MACVKILHNFASLKPVTVLIVIHNIIINLNINMKKFYFFMVALLATIAANAADWYLAGEKINGGQHWDETIEMLPTGNPGEYSVTVQSIEDRFKIKPAGGWNCITNTNSSAYVTVGEWTTNGVREDRDPGFQIREALTNVTVTVNVNTNQVLVSVKAPVVEWYIRGEFDGGTDWTTGMKMEPTENENEVAATFATLGAFKFHSNGTWYGTNAAGGKIDYDTEYPLTNANPNITLGEEAQNVTVVLNTETKTFKVALPQTGEISWWIQLYEGAEMTAEYELKATNTVGTFFIDVEDIAGSSLLLVKKEGKEIVTAYGNDDADEDYYITQTVTRYLKPGETKPLPFAASFDKAERYMVTVVTRGILDNQTSVSFVVEGDIEDFETMYVFGNNFDYAAHRGQDGFFTDSDAEGNEWVRWHANKGVAMEHLDLRSQVFFIENVLVYNSTKYDGHGLIGFAEKNGGADDDWTVVNAKRIGPAYDPYSLELYGRDRTDAVIFKSDNNVWAIAPGTYDMVVDINASRVRFYKNTDVPEELYLNGDLGFYTHYTESVKLEKGEQDGDVVEFTVKGVRVVNEDGEYGCDDIAKLPGRIEFSTKPIVASETALRRAGENGATTPLGMQNVGHRYNAEGKVGYEGSTDYRLEPTTLAPGYYDITYKFNTVTGERSAEVNTSTQTGVEDLTVDANAPVEYFNMQGVRVENPENGVYIRRQGNKVSKVIL